MLAPVVLGWTDTEELTELPEVITEVPAWVTKESALMSYTDAIPSLFSDGQLKKVRRMNEILSFVPPPEPSPPPPPAPSPPDPSPPPPPSTHIVLLSQKTDCYDTFGVATSNPDDISYCLAPDAWPRICDSENEEQTF